MLYEMSMFNKNKSRLWLEPKLEKKTNAAVKILSGCVFFPVLLGIYRSSGSYDVLVVFLGTGTK